MPTLEAGYTYAVVPCLPEQIACKRGGVHIRTFPILRALPIAALLELDYAYQYEVGVRTQAPRLRWSTAIIESTPSTGDQRTA